MSIAIMSAVWEHSKQASGNLLLLLALADYANAEGVCWPSVTTLAKRARVSERHVRRMLRELEEAGEVSVEPNAGQHGSNRYTVRIPTPDKMSPPQTDTGVIPPDASVRGPLTPASVPPDMGVSRSVIDPSLNRSDSEDPVFSHELQAAAASTVSAEEIYEAYPLKVGRAAAIAKIRLALKKKPAAFLLERTQLFAAAVARWPEDERERFIPHARTWFNQGRFDDDPRTWEKKAARKFQGKTGGTFEASQYDENPFGGEQRRETA